MDYCEIIYTYHLMDKIFMVLNMTKDSESWSIWDYMTQWYFSPSSWRVQQKLKASAASGWTYTIWIYINDPTCSLQQQRAKPTIIWSYDTDLMGIERWYIHTQSCSYMYNIYIYEYVCVFMGVYSFSNPTQKKNRTQMQFEKTKRVLLVNLFGYQSCWENRLGLL